jgi:hypothetical protein
MYQLFSDDELERWWKRFNQLGDTFHEYDPNTGLDVFEVLKDLTVERARRVKEL